MSKACCFFPSKTVPQTHPDAVVLESKVVQFWQKGRYVDSNRHWIRLEDSRLKGQFVVDDGCFSLDVLISGNVATIDIPTDKTFIVLQHDQSKSYPYHRLLAGVGIRPLQEIPLHP